MVRILIYNTEDFSRLADDTFCALLDVGWFFMVKYKNHQVSRTACSVPEAKAPEQSGAFCYCPEV